MKDLVLASNLKSARTASDISVQKISEILTQKGYRASPNTIYSWENGNSQPTPDAFMILCAVYGIDDILETFGYSNKKSPAAVQEDKGKAELDGIYYSLNEAGQEQIIDHARYIASRAEFKKCDKFSMDREEA